MFLEVKEYESDNQITINLNNIVCFRPHRTKTTSVFFIGDKHCTIDVEYNDFKEAVRKAVCIYCK